MSDSYQDPLFPSGDDQGQNPAVELIRAKVARAYSHEPDAAEALADAQADRTPSKHQRFMQELGSSGKSLAEIQTAWHHYYTTLSDAEKHDVWQEFYEANQHTPYQKLFQKHAATPTPQWQPAPSVVPGQTPEQQGVVVASHAPEPVASPAKAHKAKRQRKPASPATRALKHKISNRVSANGKLTAKHHLQSLGFGLLSGLVVLILLLFTFFNEYIIAPFIQPSRNVSSTPIILGTGTAAADAPPSVTVPKINIQIPINFSVASYEETEVDKGLETGAIHYPNTALPGQNGNGAYFGHSSGNIFNNGKYKFAFTLLHELTTGDLFYINYDGKTYAYRIIDKQVVPPTAVSVISDTKGKQATAALITCDPPGLSTNRLVVWGEQISPDPAGNTTQDATTEVEAPALLTDNGPTLWSRFVDGVTFWN